ncbi:glycosyltransferase family 4 protein [Paenibacillus sp. MSJ-34]|uniref:glycosyltransferase family 4 protein n=1 Tax=Paenibacillus sp. MSJ-34 TaxID=2841529 RepID=UPI001C11B9F0|nr:glycosyltransferase family 4 protein [Paenibacillus sp. MSJ-34]MBU5440833.1 glycosyltransferase family 4 protein [Paenibacillus sp. MSJ-34]
MRRKRKMILFSHVCNPTSITGAEKLLLFFTREMMPFYDCVLVVPGEGVLSRQARAHGIKVVVQPCPLFFLIYDPPADLPDQLERLKQCAELPKLIRLLKSERPDVVLTNTCVHILPAVAAKTLHIPVVWKITETINENANTAQSVALIDRYSDLIVGISNTTMRSFRGDAIRRKIVILPPSWRMEEFEPEKWPAARKSRRNQLGIAESTRLIGYISTFINPEKGLEHFIKMSLQICEKFAHTQFIIVGSPRDMDYYNRCLAMIQRSKHAHRFRFSGFEDSIQAIYPAMDILVVPSLVQEGFGMTALEGLIFGKPVITYRSGGLSEIQSATGNDRYVVEQGNVEQLTACVSELLADPHAEARVGRSNHQTVQSMFGIESYRKNLNHLAVRINALSPPRPRRALSARRTGKTMRLRRLMRVRKQRAARLGRKLRLKRKAAIARKRVAAAKRKSARRRIGKRINVRRRLANRKRKKVRTRV